MKESRMYEETEFEELYKIVLVGDPGVGKTNMLAFFSAIDEDAATDENGVVKTFNAVRKPTIGVEFGTKIIRHPNGRLIKAQIWDTAGQERYRAITSSHYRRAAGALLVYDIGNHESFEHACSHWLKELKNASPENNSLKSIMLVGNKSDLQAESTGKVPPHVSEEEEKKFANELNLFHMRTSAKTGHNVKEAFEKLIISIYDQDHSRQCAKKNDGINLSKEVENKSRISNCC